MGTLIYLSLGKLEVDWGKNSFFKDHGALFQESDLKQIPTYYAGENWPEGEPHMEFDEGFGKPLWQVMERINLLGFTLRVVERHYEELHRFHGLDEQPLPFARLAEALGKVDVNQISGNYSEDHDPGEFVRREILERLSLTTDLDTTGLRSDHWEVDLLLENFSPCGGLRLLAENPANLDIDVTWDFGPLVESGWAQREAFKPGPPPDKRFLIVTEGSSDAKIIEHAIKLRRPHLSDYFRFVDMEEGYPFSGTGNLFRFTQGLVSIGVQNNTLIIFDNDAAGIEKMEAMESLSLPINMRAMTLPELAEFSDFPTIGPDGASRGDINKKATAIECYLDLTHKKATSPRVRWSAFNSKTKTYQGELEGKAEYVKVFLKLNSDTKGYDFTKIDRVLEALIVECVRIAEAKEMEPSSH